eukprot:symbB.v1.2.014875.t1/scaffold1098.1/size138148/7
MEGLQSMPELNGQVGKLLTWDAQSLRWRVHIEGVGIKSFRPQNLIPQEGGTKRKAKNGNCEPNDEKEPGAETTETSEEKKQRVEAPSESLDVPDVSHVVNYSLGLSIDGYVHRIGRCGRAGRKGTAVTFVTDGDERWAGPLLKVLHEARQNIPPGLTEMAKDFSKGSSKVMLQKNKAGEVKLKSKGSQGNDSKVGR